MAAFHAAHGWGALSVATIQDVSASTQNQAFCALLFLYREALGGTLGKVDSLRAKKPVHLRYAPLEFVFDNVPLRAAA